MTLLRSVPKKYYLRLVEVKTSLTLIISRNKIGSWELKGPFPASAPELPGRGGREEDGGRLLAVLASPKTRGVAWVAGHRLGT